MTLTQATATPMIDTAAFTCAQCLFARHIDGNRYCCQVSQTASDVKRGHWEATISCYEALAAAEAEKQAALAPTATEVEAPIVKTDTTEQTSSAPATLSAKKTAPITTTTATGNNNGDEPPNRSDNGRGRVQPATAPKKLMLSLVAVKRISSDVPASNFDSFELEVAGELSLAIGGFIVPPVLVRDSAGYRVVAGHFQFHVAVLARRLNPRAGETIPAIILEPENQATALNQLKRLKFAA